MDAKDREIAAAKAKSLLEELDPYFEKLERITFEELVTLPTWEPGSDDKRRCLVDRVNTIRNLKTILRHEVERGKPTPSRPKGIV